MIPRIWLRQDDQVWNHPQVERLLAVLEDRTYQKPSGYPYICERAFIGFTRFVPHLFRDGRRLLQWLEHLRPHLGGLTPGDQTSIERAMRVMTTMVHTAAVTAPPDLWLLRQVLSNLKTCGVLDALLTQELLEPDDYAERHGLDARQLKIDCHFLFSRGLIDYEAPCFLAPLNPVMRATLQRIQPLPQDFQADWTRLWLCWFSEERSCPDLEGRIVKWLELEGDAQRSLPAWLPSHRELEIGYRLVPIVLALNTLGLTNELREGVIFDERIPNVPPGLTSLLDEAGVIDDGRVNGYGERVFKRGPGPFGIIGAYHPYLNKLDEILQKGAASVWVQRGENVAASQQANRKTFKAANDALDRFCNDYPDFNYSFFIEHAVGKGEATRQRFERDDAQRLRYFGADLEDAAIDAAISELQEGLLPADMKFIRKADIGEPERITDFLRAEQLLGQSGVMMVGNGFHEIRDQTNEKMVQVFRGYQQAGLVLSFTEETGLTNADLRATAWNTYHAGFRYVHEMSGQGLRPSWDTDLLRHLWSWRRCAEEAGYRVLDAYTTGTRPIYPIKKKGRENPTISVTYFCVPRSLAENLGVV